MEAAVTGASEGENDRAGRVRGSGRTKVAGKGVKAPREETRHTPRIIDLEEDGGAQKGEQGCM